MAEISRDRAEDGHYRANSDPNRAQDANNRADLFTTRKGDNPPSFSLK